LLTEVLSPFLNNGTTAVCFQKNGKVTLVTMRLKIQVNKGNKVSEQPLIMNDGIPSNPTYLEGLRRLTALLTSAAEITAVSKKSDVTVS
jgi:hypothetical protein